MSAKLYNEQQAHDDVYRRIEAESLWAYVRRRVDEKNRKIFSLESFTKSSICKSLLSFMTSSYINVKIRLVNAIEWEKREKKHLLVGKKSETKGAKRKIFQGIILYCRRGGELPTLAVTACFGPCFCSTCDMTAKLGWKDEGIRMRKRDDDSFFIILFKSLLIFSFFFGVNLDLGGFWPDFLSSVEQTSKHLTFFSFFLKVRVSFNAGEFSV